MASPKEEEIVERSTFLNKNTFSKSNKVETFRKHIKLVPRFRLTQNLMPFFTFLSFTQLPYQ